jgi:glycosyltransferase involved in cell wall biosynthesis
MPRIALVGPSWPYRGGISRTTTELAAALARRGSLAAFVTAARQYPRFLYPGTRDIDEGACERLPFAEPVFGVLQPLSWRRLAARVRAAAPDALVLPYWTAAWAPMEAWLARACRAPLVGVVHNPCDHDAGWTARRAADLVLGRCRGFLCHARSVAAGIGERYPGAPVAVHPLATAAAGDSDRRTARGRLGIAPDRVALLCFGLIRPYKGIDVLVEAVSRLPESSPFVLLLAGEPWGALDPATRERLDRLQGAGRAVVRLEWVPEEEVRAWFGAADAMALPYRTATGSAVAAQALGHGLPIVASAVGGLGEIVEDGRSGLLVPPGDAGALAAAIARLLDPELRRRLGAGACAAAAAWSWDSYAAALEALVAKVLGRASARP